MVNRIFVEKKPNFASESKNLKDEFINLLQIEAVEDVRIINRYDVEGISEDIFRYAVKTVFSEPQVDTVFESLDLEENDIVFAVEYLPGQFDQRASSASECIQIISKGERPVVRTAKIYVIKGNLTVTQLEEIKRYVINPIESREAALKEYESLAMDYDIPTEVETLSGFRNFTKDEMADFAAANGLAMDLGDLEFCRSYFNEEDRDPTITEIKVIDTYWSDHCRHTTFNTIIDSVTFENEKIANTYNEYIDMRQELNRTKPVTLMDIGTIAAKYLRKNGMLKNLDESEEINACTVKTKVKVNGREEDWLLLFKNETHNHPTEIEPFGGAATCVGGAIRDPLSGRSYVYSAMRLTGAANPLVPVSDTMKGKLPQRKIVTTAAAGYSSYGNQIGLATGQVDELYHKGYLAKRMEIGAVIAAAPADNVRRERPAPTDVVILLGGKTGRDGCGGATGSSKSHTLESLESCGAEVQKGNAPEERKLQRLFRNPKVSKMIKRCNDFGAGGVSVAIGELADGLEINLNCVPKKYEGLDGTELAISESQERMAVVIAADDIEEFKKEAFKENLEASVVAEVTDNPYLVINWNDKKIVNISREFLDTNGAEKHIDIEVEEIKPFDKAIPDDFSVGMRELVGDLNVCSKRGLSERFDSTIGAGTVLMPFGGKNQRTPAQAMVNLISMEKENAETCSVMAWGYNPNIAEKSPYDSAYLAVIESVSKLISTGARFEDVYLSFQEYFEKPMDIPTRWGQPLAAVLGAFKAQKDLGIAAIGGKDSMSGTFENIDVPPTLVSFAVTTADAKDIISPEFKGVDNKVIMLTPALLNNGLPDSKALPELFKQVGDLIASGKVLSAYTPAFGGVGEAIYKMAIGNDIGFEYNDDISIKDVFKYSYGAFILELAEEINVKNAITLGFTRRNRAISLKGDVVSLEELDSIYEGKLEPVYNMNVKNGAKGSVAPISYKTENKIHASYKVDKPKVLIPVFPGTNCEYDSAKAFEASGAEAEIFVINNQNSESIEASINEFATKIRASHIIFIPGGFSGGDEPDGSGKLITAFFRNEQIKDAVNDLIENREGLIAGICNGFQALIKLGLVPYGRIIDTDESCPTLTLNEIGRHQSKIVNLKPCSNKSPWMANVDMNTSYQVPISHGEGRFICSSELFDELKNNGQILTQYVDLNGNPTMDIEYNPNGSYMAVEGITSPDGRILGKMGHAERIGENLYKNVLGNYDMEIFRSAVEYFR
ncbi:MAG: phosphoribosylformylglycinamidine synthase [Peptostreptococcaceae bacterium]|nr:phosphoribosylformylglycinamidine synthase [Peptostreptococcaceae bacterium]